MKTALSGEQAREILRHYNLKLRGHWPLLRGTINSNYVVDTDAGPLFLRINEGKKPVDVAFEAALIWHLGTRGLPTPALWRTRTGGPTVPLPVPPGEPFRPVMLMSWIEGSERTDEELKENEAHLVGELLAKLHLAAAGFVGQRAGIYTLRRIAQRLERVRTDARAQAELGPVLDELSTEAERLVTARSGMLPQGIGHGDLFPDNFLFTDTKDGGCILDLEQAATMPYVYDLAVALLSFCAPTLAVGEAPDESRLGPFRRQTARALFAGYQAFRALGTVERKGLYEELRYAALRFTVTRLTDVHGYGRKVDATPAAPSTADSSDAATTKDSRPRFLRKAGPRHSKDYRDFLWRLRSLAAVDGDALLVGLE